MEGFAIHYDIRVPRHSAFKFRYGVSFGWIRLMILYTDLDIQTLHSFTVHAKNWSRKFSHDLSDNRLAFGPWWSMTFHDLHRIWKEGDRRLDGNTCKGTGLQEFNKWGRAIGPLALSLQPWRSSSVIEPHPEFPPFAARGCVSELLKTQGLSQLWDRESTWKALLLEDWLVCWWD